MLKTLVSPSRSADSYIWRWKVSSSESWKVNLRMVVEPTWILSPSRERVLGDALAVAEGAVGRAEIADDDLVALVDDLGVAARDAVVDDLDVGLLSRGR